MTKFAAFLKRETVLSISWALALASMLLVPPDGEYLGYIDFHSLGLGLFRRLGEAMLERTATLRQLEGVLIFLPFFTSMAVTNDVALITFVPFALEVLKLAGREDRLIPVVAMQTVAANLGSMTTPIGNPQNLYLYAHYQLSLGDFFTQMLPLTIGSGILLALFLVFEKSAPLSFPRRSRSPLTGAEKAGLARYALLFALCLCAVAKVLPVWAAAGVVLAAVLVFDRKVLVRVDWSLLLTFVGFFLFVGNLGRVPAFRDFFQAALAGREVICSVLASQVISNVPAALLLSGFTDNGAALLVGANLGGLGTLIASMASLISFKQIARHDPRLRGRYLLWFTGANLVFLAILLGLYGLIA